MAIFNGKRQQWEWTDKDRNDRKQAVRRIQRQLDGIKEQVRGIKTYIPAFAAPAEEVLQAIWKNLKDLASLNITNRGPRYHAISPEEADRLITTIPAMMKLWQDFVTEPTFAAAARRKNSEIRAENARVREHNKIVSAANAAILEQMEDAFRKIDNGDISGALDTAAKLGVL